MAVTSPFDTLNDAFFTGVVPPAPVKTEPLTTLEQMLHYFPFPTIRPVQTKALSVVADAHDSGKRHTILEIPTGGGKCLAAGTPVLMFDGSTRPIEGVAVGDIVMGDDSTPRTVTETHHGRGPLFDVLPKKGSSYRVNEKHILTLQYTNDTKSAEYSHRGTRMTDGWTLDLPVQEYLTLSKRQKRLLKGVRKGVEFPAKALPLPPYFLGLWLGEGSRDVTEADRPVLDYIVRFSSSIDLGVAEDPQSHCGNPVLSHLRSLGVLHDEHIPLLYKTGDRDQRLELLAGLIDSDGHRHHDGFDVVFRVKRLAEDATFVCRSLGFAAYCNPCEKSTTNSPSGQHREVYYRVSVSGAGLHKVPVLLSHKKPKVRQPKKDVLCTAIQVVPAGIGDYYGFEIDGNGRFLLGDFTVTHNSPISMAVGRFAGEAKDIPGAHILTSQNNLLTQMMGDFQHLGLVDIRGKANYRCADHHTDCATGSAVGGGKTCDNCPYRAAKNRFISSPLGVTNYTYYLAESRFVNEVNPRQYLILDEAHNLEDEILAAVHIEVRESRAQELQISLPHFDPDDQAQARTWLGDTFIPAAEKREAYLRAQIVITNAESTAATDEGIKRRLTESVKDMHRKLSALVALIGNVQAYLGDSDQRNWLAWTGEKDSLTIRPLSAAAYAQDLIFRRSPHALMMSATILDSQTFQRNLGLSPSDTNVFAAPSDFPKENRRIVYWPSGSMSYHNINETLPLVAKRTELLMEKYADQKGIIFSHSYRINNYLEEYFSVTKHRHRIITHTSKPGAREAAIAEHCRSTEPTILLSPSMTEGLDLKDDLSRFQVVTKIPYPFLDPYTRARMTRDERWYQLKTALALIQATGRSVRSETDRAITVILDAAFENFLIKNQDILPEWWKSAIEFK